VLIAPMAEARHLRSQFLTFIGLFFSAPWAPSFFFADPWPLDRTRHTNLNRNERMKREIKFDKFYLRIEMEDLWALFGQDSGELEGTARYKGSWS